MQADWGPFCIENLKCSTVCPRLQHLLKVKYETETIFYYAVLQSVCRIQFSQEPTNGRPQNAFSVDQKPTCLVRQRGLIKTNLHFMPV